MTAAGEAAGKGYAAPPATDIRSALVLRRNAEGALRIQGEPPARHVLPASFINRELGAAIEVTVTVQADAGPVVYRMTGFEPLGDGRPNLSGWLCERVTDGG